MRMEAEGTTYQINQCKDCGIQFLVKSGSLRWLCDICAKERVLQHKKLLSTLGKANTLKKGV